MPCHRLQKCNQQRNGKPRQRRSTTNNTQGWNNEAKQLTNNGINQRQYEPPTHLDIVNNRLPLCLLSPSNFVATRLCRQLAPSLPVSVAGVRCSSPQSPPVFRRSPVYFARRQSTRPCQILRAPPSEIEGGYCRFQREINN